VHSSPPQLFSLLSRPVLRPAFSVSSRALFGYTPVSPPHTHPTYAHTSPTLHPYFPLLPAHSKTAHPYSSIRSLFLLSSPLLSPSLPAVLHLGLSIFIIVYGLQEYGTQYEPIGCK